MRIRTSNTAAWQIGRPSLLHLQLILLCLKCFTGITASFVLSPSFHATQPSLSSSATCTTRTSTLCRSTTTPTTSSASFTVKKLTDRQYQFWEDVDDGLDAIEAFYAKQNQTIDRIRQFALRYEVTKCGAYLSAMYTYHIFSQLY